MAAPAAAQEPAAPPAMGPHGIAQETTVGVLHAAGYVIGSIQTSPVTDASVNRFGFVMEHPEGAAMPLYACRLMIGSGDPESLEPMVMINTCHRLD